MNHRNNRPVTLIAASLFAAALLPNMARGDMVLSSNDGHSIQNAQKKIVAPSDPHPDTVSLIDVGHAPPVVRQTIEVPGSVVGPPTAAWMAKDESWAIVTSATKADAQSPGGIAPDDRVSVLDLSSTPAKIAQSLTSGLGATTVRVSPDGTLALIANRTEGTVSVFSVADKRLTPVTKVDLGNKASLPSGIVFTADGKDALLSRGGDNMVSVLHINGTAVTVDPRPITTGLAPYTMDVNATRTLAVVSNMGRGDGDVELGEPDRSDFETIPHRGDGRRSERTRTFEILARRQIPCRRRGVWQHETGERPIPPRQGPADDVRGRWEVVATPDRRAGRGVERVDRIFA